MIRDRPPWVSGRFRHGVGAPNPASPPLFQPHQQQQQLILVAAPRSLRRGGAAVVVSVSHTRDWWFT